MIDWTKITATDSRIIGKIAMRAAGELGYPVMDADMDVSACHIVCPLKLEELLVAGDGDFAHDVAGIKRHINRESGELGDCFVPRFAERE